MGEIEKGVLERERDELYRLMAAKDIDPGQVMRQSRRLDVLILRHMQSSGAYTYNNACTMPSEARDNFQVG